MQVKEVRSDRLLVEAELAAGNRFSIPKLRRELDGDKGV
jgi:hypothetical protein